MTSFLKEQAYRLVRGNESNTHTAVAVLVEKPLFFLTSLLIRYSLNDGRGICFIAAFEFSSNPGAHDGNECPLTCNSEVWFAG